MMTRERLERTRLPMTDAEEMLVIGSHLEALAAIEVYKAESVLKNGLINQYKGEIEKLKEQNNELKIIISRQSSQIAMMGIKESK